MSSPDEPRRPDDGPRPDQAYPAPGYPYGSPPGQAEPPHVYNPYGNVSYPATYPVPPAGLGGDDTALPARRPGSVTLALVLLVVSALPYLFVGLLAFAAAGDVEAVVPPGQLPQLPPGVELGALVRATGVVLLGVGLVFVLLAVLAFTGRRWARALVAAMTVGFVLMVLVSVALQGGAVDGAGLLVLAVPVVLAGVGVALLHGSAARAWFSRPRR